MHGILLAVLVVGGTGIIIGLLLGISGKIFEVHTDEREVKIRDCLPGNNCGGCGFAGCDSLAKAIANNEADVNACPVGGAAVAKEIGKIMGVSADAKEVCAVVHCKGTCDKVGQKFNYYGTMSCSEAAILNGGPKNCSYGCMGLGSCMSVCEYGAISVVDGVAKVDRELCVGCGKCAKVCPKGLISIIPKDQEEVVLCNNKDNGKKVREVCSLGCIGCKMCTKNCPTDAVTVTDNLASIDPDLCVGCGLCKAACPTKVIS